MIWQPQQNTVNERGDMRVIVVSGQFIFETEVGFPEDRVFGDKTLNYTQHLFHNKINEL